MALVLYDRLYRRKAIRRPAHFLKPRILEATEFDFPVSSVFQWWKVLDNEEYLTRSYGYFYRTDKAQVESFFDYSEDAKEGKFVNKTFLINAYLTENSKRCKEYKFLKPNQSMSIPDKILKVANYGAINSKYRYTTHPLKEVNKFKNTFTTVLHNMFKTGRQHVFLLLDVPNTIPSRIELEKFSKRLLVGQLNKVPTYKHLILLELWKFLNPELMKESIFYKIPKDRWKDVNLLFSLDNKLLFINLNYLMGNIKELGLEVPGAKPRSAMVFRKIIYIMFKTLIESAAMTEAELDKHEAEIEKNGNHIESKMDTIQEDENSEVKTTEIVEPVKETIITDKDTPKKEIIDIPVQKYMTAGGSMAIGDKNPNNGESSLLARLRNNTFQNNVSQTPKEDEVWKEKNDYNTLVDETDEEVEELDKKYEEDLNLLEEQYQQQEETIDDDEDQPSKLETDINNTEIVETTDTKSIKEIEVEEPDFVKGVTSRIDYLTEMKVMPKKTKDNIIRTIEVNLNSKDPFDPTKKIKDTLDISKDQITLNADSYKITPNKVVFDNSYNNNIINKVREDYIENFYHKDLVRTIYSLQNAGYVVEKFEVDNTGSILGEQENYKVTLRTLDNKTHSFSFILPKLNKDGTFKLSGNTYNMRAQRLIQVLAKIDYNTVKMTSYYGTIFVKKANYKKDDSGYYIQRQLGALYNQPDSPIKNLILTPPNLEELKLPLDYATFGRYIKSFRYNNMVFTFDYDKRNLLFKDFTMDQVKILEDKDLILFGVRGKNPLLMNMKNQVFEYIDNKYVETDDIYTLIHIDRYNQPIEHSVIKIFKEYVPTCVMFSYYMGINNLMKTLKLKYRIEERNKRVIALPDEYIIKFKDVQLIIKRDDGLGDMIFAGFLSIKDVLKEISFKSLDNKNSFMVLFNKLGYPVLYINEIKAYEDLFLDPMTLAICKELKYPTNFKGLLFKANEMLLDDYYKNPNNITQMSIKGYERICGMVYNEIVRALRDYSNKSLFSKANISIKPFSIISAINDDSTTVLVDDLNPMTTIKQTEDVSYLGKFGMNKDAMAKESRIYNYSEIGVISEGAKDSTDVGITSYMTAAPKLSTVRGKVDNEDFNKTEMANLFSSSALLAPFSTRDDTKRLRN